MKEPLVSIFWLNHNSSSFIDIALESLQGILDLDYSNYELIVVDNCSTDRSLGVINGFITKKMKNMKVKVIGVHKNLGFNGGNNIAYRAMNRESKYVVLLNNDAVPYSNSLSKLIEYAEGNQFLGALEGAYLGYDGKTVNGAGNFMSELFTTYSMQSIVPRLHSITYACGIYSIHRVSSIRKAVGQNDSIFDDNMFAYYDDYVLGLKMWNIGYAIATCPIVAARHKGSASFGRIRPLQAYLEARGLATLNEISNSIYRRMVGPFLMNSICARAIFNNRASNHGTSHNTRELLTAILKGLKDGHRIGKRKRHLGETIDIYKAPIVRVNVPMLIGLIPGIQLAGRFVTKLEQNKLNPLIID